MVADGKSRHFFQGMKLDRPVQITVEGSDIQLRQLEKKLQLELTALVYSGGNFIPKSVQKGLTEKVAFGNEEFPTYLSLDEVSCQIKLSHLCSMEGLSKVQFVDILEEFSFQIKGWRDLLDDRGRDDLVYVYSKRS